MRELENISVRDGVWGESSFPSQQQKESNKNLSVLPAKQTLVFQPCLKIPSRRDPRAARHAASGKNMKPLMLHLERVAVTVSAV